MPGPVRTFSFRGFHQSAAGKHLGAARKSSPTVGETVMIAAAPRRLRAVVHNLRLQRTQGIVPILSPTYSRETELIDLNELIETARRKNDRTAIIAYQSLHARMIRLMSLPGPKQGKPLKESKIILLIHDEIKDRRDSNEFMAPTRSGFADNQHIIKLLSKLVPK